MTSAETAMAFTAMLKAGHHEEAAAKFNDEAIVSYEAMEGPMSVCTGKAAVKAKSDWWYANNEIHSVTSEGPYVNGDTFAVRFAMDVTDKATGNRVQMDEVGIYTVAGGKIVSERFCYGQG